jgi:type II secretory pathway predicted ATPase ExeA
VGGIDHCYLARQHRAKLLQSVARTVGVGKTVAVRAATAALDGSRHAIIYLPNPSVGMRGMLHHIVTALGHTPKFYTATLAPQAADALATEHAERGRTPVIVVDITDRD